MKRILCRFSEFTRLTGMNMQSHRNPRSSSYVYYWTGGERKVFHCFCADTFLTKFNDYATRYLANVNPLEPVSNFSGNLFALYSNTEHGLFEVVFNVFVRRARHSLKTGCDRNSVMPIFLEGRVVWDPVTIIPAK